MGIFAPWPLRLTSPAFLDGNKVGGNSDHEVAAHIYAVGKYATFSL